MWRHLADVHIYEEWNTNFFNGEVKTTSQIVALVSFLD